ncbi:hypothetical protein D9758_018588 [Tetrapyrgos nigripes]|uniref:Nephrocystin 3-like N-terminal domain-containing protein n=1 Tax=Tetrapyrgos nigripes TaxID=182062 RepID=A0A8H5EZU6_9AGAR|nr:hypothetical protein D9758_018588 [Tetrapyrgos nigripes]
MNGVRVAGKGKFAKDVELTIGPGSPVPPSQLAHRRPAMKKVRKLLHINKKQNKSPNASATRASGTPPPIAQISSTTATQPLSTDGTQGIVNTICDGFTEALKIAKEATTGVPIAEPVLRGVVAAIELGKIDYRTIAFDKASYLYLGILGCTETLKEEGDKIRNMQTHGLLMRIAQGTANADNLLSAYKNIEQAIGNLRLALQLAIERDTSTIRKNSALQSLPIASAAAYTSGIYEPDVVRRACTKGTRTEVLEDIRHWLQSENAAPVFWLTGAAGMGKTTIAMTICEEIEYLFHSTVATGPVTDDSGGQRPVVSFFASRQLDSGKPQYLLPTICRRLADFSSSYAGQLVCALEGDSGLATAKLDIQFEGMLVKPWQVSSSERTRDLPICIVVIDALDENGNGFLFLKKLLGAVRDSKLEGLRFLVTSRTEPHIAELCSSFEPGAVCRLQEVPVYEVQQDISLYLQQELSGLRKDTLQLIVEQSCGLFIYAATVVKMATGSTGSTKGEQEYIIQELLNATSNSTNDHFLSKLYQQIVKDGLHHNNKGIQDKRLHILHVILCTVHALPADIIAQLTNTDKEDVSFVVNQLHAVMYVAHDGRIQTYHASFADFALQYECSVGEVHASLVQHCYDIMKKQLNFNICGLESSFIMDKDIPDLETRVATKIHPTIQYAIIYWTTHLEKSTPSDTLKNTSKSFVDNLLLFWLEAVNLLNARIDAMRALHLAQNWIDKHDKPSIDIWKDTINFCRSFTSSEMCKSTPHLYVSALSTWDPQSHVSKHWQPRFPNIPKVSLCGNITKWGSDCVWGGLMGLSVCGMQQVESSSRSSQGTQVGLCLLHFHQRGIRLCLGGHDSSVRVWDAASGEQLKELTGHSASGEQLKELTGHSGWVQSVAFSPKGDQIVSGGDDSSVHVWDAASGEQLKELTGHSASGEQLKELTGHSGWVESVAFSPKGDQIVSGGEDSSVHVWDAASGEQLKELTGHSGWVQSVAFSPKGDQIVSGGDDSSVCVWDAASGEQLKELTGHSGWVESVAFSPKGDQIVSGGKTLLCMCGMQQVESSSRSSQGTQVGLQVESSSRSSQGTQVGLVCCIFTKGGSDCVWGDDSSVHVWDAASGEQLKELTGHSGWVQSVAFSPKGDQIVSGGSDSSVHVWDAASGEQLKELTGHSGWV